MILTCARCRRETTDTAASQRKFFADRCAYCGGDLYGKLYPPREENDESSRPPSSRALGDGVQLSP